MNCKGFLTHITRPVKSMSKNGRAGIFSSLSEGKKSAKFDKKKWLKRVRNYFKIEIKNIEKDENN